MSFHITRGETLAVVGESGSGKSVMSLSIMQLAQPGRFAGGQILLQGEDLLKKTEREMRRIRGNDVSMIFQEPMTSLNPVFTIGDQIAETISLHQRQSRSRAMRLAIEMLELVGIPEPARRATTYPHQMSGGMRQRAMIAMALSCGPKLLIADEPTTALDVTIQAQILDLMRKLQNDIGMSILFITHDLGVVAEVADRVVVMYAGQAVEEASVEAIFARPRMPYTIGLLESVPRVDRIAARQERLRGIPGNVPDSLALPQGCPFHPRCRFAFDACRLERPQLEDTGGGHMSRCLRWNDLGPQAERIAPIVARGAMSVRRSAEPTRLLVEVKNLRAYFPYSRRRLLTRRCKRQSGTGYLVQRRGRRSPRARRRVRFWEDHGWARNRGAHRPDIGRGALRGCGCNRRHEDSTARAEEGDADNLSGSLRLARSAYDCWPNDRRSARHP